MQADKRLHKSPKSPKSQVASDPITSLERSQDVFARMFEEVNIRPDDKLAPNSETSLERSQDVFARLREEANIQPDNVDNKVASKPKTSLKRSQDVFAHLCAETNIRPEDKVASNPETSYIERERARRFRFVSIGGILGATALILLMVGIMMHNTANSSTSKGKLIPPPSKTVLFSSASNSNPNPNLYSLQGVLQAPEAKKELFETSGQPISPSVSPSVLFDRIPSAAISFSAPYINAFQKGPNVEPSGTSSTSSQTDPSEPPIE